MAPRRGGVFFVVYFCVVVLFVCLFVCLFVMFVFVAVFLLAVSILILGFGCCRVLVLLFLSDVLCFLACF